jgi:hypothetical protein
VTKQQVLNVISQTLNSEKTTFSAFETRSQYYQIFCIIEQPVILDENDKVISKFSGNVTKNVLESNIEEAIEQ